MTSYRSSLFDQFVCKRARLLIISMTKVSSASQCDNCKEVRITSHFTTSAVNVSKETEDCSEVQFPETIDNVLHWWLKHAQTDISKDEKNNQHDTPTASAPQLPRASPSTSLWRRCKESFDRQSLSQSRKNRYEGAKMLWVLYLFASYCMCERARAVNLIKLSLMHNKHILMAGSHGVPSPMSSHVSKSNMEAASQLSKPQQIIKVWFISI